MNLKIVIFSEKIENKAGYIKNKGLDWFKPVSKPINTQNCYKTRLMIGLIGSNSTYLNR